MWQVEILNDPDDIAYFRRQQNFVIEAASGMQSAYKLWSLRYVHFEFLYRYIYVILLTVGLK